MDEVGLPAVKARNMMIKDSSISLLPNIPSGYDQNFHEEMIFEGVIGVGYHIEERKTVIPMDTKPLPTSLAEWTNEEKMHSCFFHTTIAIDTAVVIVGNLMFLSS